MTLVNVGYTGRFAPLFVGAQWAYSGGQVGYPPPAAPPPVQARFRVRQIILSVMVNGVELDDVQWVRCRFSLTEPVASAEIMCPFRHGTYNQTVEIYAGATPGYGRYLRFRGFMRNPSADLFPRSVSHKVVGLLSLLAEFFPAEGAVLGGGRFGLLIPHVLGRLSIGGAWQPSYNAPNNSSFMATSAAITRGVLDMAGLAGLYDPLDILGSKRLYGLPNWEDFVWSTGAPQATQIMPDVTRESGLQYLSRYDDIDAEWGGEDNFWAGGFYRLTEGLGGRIYRRRTGGKPGSMVDPTTGLPIFPPQYYFTFTEGQNILDGSRIERQYPKGNRCWVQGHDTGAAGIGAYRFLAQRNNGIPGFGQDDNKLMPNAPSSPMIMWRSYDTSVSGNLYDPDGNLVNDGAVQMTAAGVAAGNYTLAFSDQLVGQDCQTVAEATLLDGNKEASVGQIVSGEDAPFTQAMSVMVLASVPITDDNAGGTVDRLLSGEPFLINGLTLDVGHGSSGEPNFRQTLDVGAGGLDAQQAFGVLPAELFDQPPPGAGSTPLDEDPPGPSLPDDIP